MHDWSILIEFIESDVWNFEVSDQNSIVRLKNEYSFFFFFQEDRYTVEYNLKLISNNINDRDNIDLFHSFKQIDNFVSSLRLRIKFIDRLHRLSIYRRIIKTENYFYRLIGLIRVDTLHDCSWLVFKRWPEDESVFHAVVSLCEQRIPRGYGFTDDRKIARGKLN